MEQNNKSALKIFIENFYDAYPWHNHLWHKQTKFEMWKSDGTQIIYEKFENKDEYIVCKSDSSDIVYTFNKDGFRSKSFQQNNNLPFILTAGCSNTFGYQLPEELRWTNIIENNYQNKINVYNLGVAGLDAHRILGNCYNFIKTFGKPEYLFLLLPPFYRNISVVYKKNKKGLVTKQTPLFFSDLDEFNNVFKTDKYNSQNLLFHHINALHNFEQFCYINNIKLFWFCWDNLSQNIYEGFNFEKIVLTKDFANLENDNVDNILYWDWAADNNHQGYRWHKKWANTFIKKINENKNDNSWN